MSLEQGRFELWVSMYPCIFQGTCTRAPWDSWLVESMDVEPWIQGRGLTVDLHPGIAQGSAEARFV